MSEDNPKCCEESSSSSIDTSQLSPHATAKRRIAPSGRRVSRHSVLYTKAPPSPSSYKHLEQWKEISAENCQSELYIPKRQWEAQVLQMHPEVLETRERFACMNGHQSYAVTNHGQTSFTEARDAVPHEAITCIIGEYLHELGLSKVVTALQEETRSKVSRGLYGGHALPALLKLGIADTKELFVAPQSDEQEGENDATVEVVDHPNYMADRDDDLTDLGNIWANTMPGQTNVNEHGDPIAATPLMIIEMLSSPGRSDPDLHKAFLLCFRNFMQPLSLLRILIDRHKIPQEVLDDPIRNKHVQIIKQRVGNLLRAWVTKSYHDFSEAMRKVLDQFINDLLHDPANASVGTTIRTAVAKSAYAESTASVHPAKPVEPKVPRNIFSPEFSVFDVDDEEIARQITLIDSRLMAQVKREEFLGKVWKKPLNPNNIEIRRVLQRFEDIKTWCSYEICKPFKLKHKARVMGRFIKVAENYQTCSAIIAAIQTQDVDAIQRCRNEIPKKSLEIFHDLENCLGGRPWMLNRPLDPTSKPLWVSEIMRNPSTPVVPMLSYPLVSLELLDGEYKDYVASVANPSLNLVNLTKMKKVWEIVTEFEEFMSRDRYNILPVVQITRKLAHFDESITNMTSQDLNRMELQGPTS